MYRKQLTLVIYHASSYRDLGTYIHEVFYPTFSNVITYTCLSQETLRKQSSLNNIFQVITTGEARPSRSYTQCVAANILRFVDGETVS